MGNLRVNLGFGEFFKYVLVAILIAIIATAFFLAVVLEKIKANEVFVGVEVGFDNFEDIARFVDEVKDCVNLIVIGSLNITTNATRLTGTAQQFRDNAFFKMPETDALSSTT